ncbi:TPA: hypothetical protein DEP96_04125 [Candidatus Uhrbacteria bacterium]|nr:hypothetical protein [Candidatus Uhrbacteria bacterium]
MLHKDDMAAIRATMQEVIKETVPAIVKDTIEQNNHIFKLELRDEMYAMNKSLENRLNKKIEDTRRETVLDIAGILEVSVLPQISELQCEMIVVKQDIVELKQKVAVR